MGGAALRAAHQRAGRLHVHLATDEIEILTENLILKMPLPMG